MTTRNILTGDDPWKPSADVPGAFEHVMLDTDTFELIDVAAWADVDPPPRKWMMERWLPRRRAAYITGKGGAGKSLLGQQLATCIALGLPFLGVETTQAPVIYLTAEDDTDELQRRQRDICRMLGISEAELKLKLFPLSLFGKSDNKMVHFDRDEGMQTQTTWTKLKATAHITLAKFIVLDNVSHFFEGSEIDRSQVTAFANLLNGLASEIDGTVLLIGHPNKQGDAYSGSTAWENAFRARLFFDAPKESQPDPDLRELSLPKANYARKDAKIEVRLHKGALIRTDDLPPSLAAELRQVSAQTAANDAFLNCLRERVRQGAGREVGPKRSANYAPTQFEKMPQAKGFKKDDLAAAMERLFAIGKIRCVQMRNTAKGRDVNVIEEVLDSVPEHSPRTLTPDAPEPAENRPRTHSLYPTDIMGGPMAGPPNFHPDDLDWES
ncbi:MAG: AAA family ATPase [Novosphingobium sp.]|nr:AAA family ATPase [Novosphingobium sp.]